MPASVTTSVVGYHPHILLRSSSCQNNLLHPHQTSSFMNQSIPAYKPVINNKSVLKCSVYPQWRSAATATSAKKCLKSTICECRKAQTSAVTTRHLHPDEEALLTAGDSNKPCNPLTENATDDEAAATKCENKLYRRNKVVDSLEDEAWDLLCESMVNYCGTPVGTIAANDPSTPSTLNYDQVFIRDFVPSGIAFLLKGEFDIVRNFILHTLQLQSWVKTMDCHSPGQGLMPASFKVRTVHLEGDDENATEEVLDPDFGEAAIGRVAPVDSGLWWIILLRAYGKSSGDLSVQERVDVQTGIKMILKLCLVDGFDMFPTLLVTDGSCMIDHRMGIHGHPLEIQSLFYSALLCSREMLAPEEGLSDLIRALNSRLVALSFHIREYYWIEMRKLNEIYRYNTEEYLYDAVNKFNIYPDQIPPWLVEWMPQKGGYLIGNLQPAHMDFRFFSLGNLWAIVSRGVHNRLTGFSVSRKPVLMRY